MPIDITNTHPDNPRVTLFGQMENGSYEARVMAETDVPYGLCWENAVDQVMVYLEPTQEQLELILNALKEGRLRFSDLQDYGSSNGGFSTLPI